MTPLTQSEGYNINFIPYDFYDNCNVERKC
jgi:hypothetical protein